MSATVDTRVSFSSQSQRKSGISNEELGMLIFILTEIMFFMALVSAYVVIRASSLSYWVPPTGVRLPVEITALNTFYLFLSGVLLWLSGRCYAESPERSRRFLLYSCGFGAGFVGFQGYEWMQLMSVGMSMTSGVFSACFYLLIGSHGLHAVAGVLALVLCYRKFASGHLTAAGFKAIRLFWYFVVAVWPVLYGLVYF